MPRAVNEHKIIGISRLSSEPSRRIRLCGSALSRLQPFHSCQLGLALVESPESFCFEFEGAGDMQAVESAHAEFRPIAAGQVSANIERLLRHLDFHPRSSDSVASQFKMDTFSLPR